jgi:GR25 family glycosyltransferase involved in LPS biosynthesis
MNLIDAIYYINLDKSVERNKLMKELLKDEIFKDMKKHRIKAIDGKKNTSYLHRKLKNMDTNKFSLSEYGCLLSHLNTILTFSRSKYNIALICEDDLSLEYKPYWTTSLNTCIQNAPSDWGILQICILVDKLPTYLYTKWDRFYSTGAYLIRKEQAIKCINDIYINNQFILNSLYNHVSDQFIYKTIPTYTYKYPFFTFTGKNSTIHTSHVKNEHIPSKKTIKKLLQKRYKSKKIKS